MTANDAEKARIARETLSRVAASKRKQLPNPAREESALSQCTDSERGDDRRSWPPKPQQRRHLQSALQATKV